MPAVNSAAEVSGLTAGAIASIVVAILLALAAGVGYAAYTGVLIKVMNKAPVETRPSSSVAVVEMSDMFSNPMVTGASDAEASQEQSATVRPTI